MVSNDGMSFLAARSRSRPYMTSTFDFLTQIFGPLKFFVYLLGFTVKTLFEVIDSDGKWAFVAENR